MKPFFPVCIATVLALSSCKKEDNDPLKDLPEATQTGANRMGCLVDGKAFQPITDSFLGKAMSVSRYRDGVFRLSFVQNEDNLNRHIILAVRDVRLPGTYVLNQAARPNFASAPSHANYITSNPEPSREYLTGPTATGQLIVTRFDSVAKIVSGTFEFTAQQINGPATVHVTQGRFDVQYE